MMRETSFILQIYHPSESFSKSSYVSSEEEYRKAYKKSIEEPEEFWKEISAQFHFQSPQPSDKKYFEYNFNIKDGPIYTKFMEGATTNISYNVLDHNIKIRNLKDTVAFYW